MLPLIKSFRLFPKPRQEFIKIGKCIVERSQYSAVNSCDNYKCVFNNKFQRGISSVSSQCWKCGSERSNSDLFCNTCNAIQKPSEEHNYFRIFDMKPTYEIQLNGLAKKYRNLQNVLHPDRFVNSNEEEKEISEECSSLVNKAYNTLVHPLSRGLYMLELKGIHLEEGNVQSDPEFLMELMDRNEEVDQAKTEAEVASLNAKNKLVMEELSRSISEAFKMGDLQKATENLIKMKYYASIDTKIKVLKQKKGFAD